MDQDTSSEAVALRAERGDRVLTWDAHPILIEQLKQQLESEGWTVTLSGRRSPTPSHASRRAGRDQPIGVGDEERGATVQGPWVVGRTRDLGLGLRVLNPVRESAGVLGTAASFALSCYSRNEKLDRGLEEVCARRLSS